MLDQKQLHQIALDYPWYMFTGEEIAELCNVSQNVISRVKAMSDSPFFLNKCRPEWFLEWMRNHPEFQLTKSRVMETALPCQNAKRFESEVRSLPIRIKKTKPTSPPSREISNPKR